MSTVIRYVAPSADTTGATDTAAIQAAIDAVQAAASAISRGIVVLSGYYYINAPLTCGAVNTSSRVSIAGAGHAVIARAGTASTDYAIKLYGGSGGTKGLLSDIRVLCGYKCRGILVTRATTLASIENVQVYQSRQSGIDLIDCWGMNVRNIAVVEPRGFAMRIEAGNNCHFDSVYCGSGYAFYSSNSSVVTSSVITDYAMENGGESAAASEYPTAYATDWPATDDTVCTDYGGTAFQSAVADRACIYFSGDGSQWTNFGLENNRYVDQPLLHVAKSTTLNNTFKMRLENNKTRLEKVLMTSSRYNIVGPIGTSDGLPLGADYTQPSTTTACDTWMRCTGTTRGNKLTRLVGNCGCSTSLIDLSSGTHTGTTCEECSTACGHIAESAWINVGDNGANVNATWPDRTY